MADEIGSVGAVPRARPASMVVQTELIFSAIYRWRGYPRGAPLQMAITVLDAGGPYHVFRAPANLQDGQGRVAKFHYEWNDPTKLGFILGHHLLLLGFGALALAGKAMWWGGIYDSALHQVRLVSAPTLNPVTIFSYLGCSGNFRSKNYGSWC